MNSFLSKFARIASKETLALLLGEAATDFLKEPTSENWHRMNSASMLCLTKTLIEDAGLTDFDLDAIGKTDNREAYMNLVNKIKSHGINNITEDTNPKNSEENHE